MPTKKGQVFYKTDGRCAYCGKVLDPFSGWQIEHIMPKAQGGSNDLENLVPACSLCNRRKKDKTPEEFSDWIAHRLFADIWNMKAFLSWASDFITEEEYKNINDRLEDLKAFILKLYPTFFSDEIRFAGEMDIECDRTNNTESTAPR